MPKARTLFCPTIRSQLFKHARTNFAHRLLRSLTADHRLSGQPTYMRTPPSLLPFMQFVVDSTTDKWVGGVAITMTHHWSRVYDVSRWGCKLLKACDGDYSPLRFWSLRVFLGLICRLAMIDESRSMHVHVPLSSNRHLTSHHLILRYRAFIPLSHCPGSMSVHHIIVPQRFRNREQYRVPRLLSHPPEWDHFHLSV